MDLIFEQFEKWFKEREPIWNKNSITIEKIHLEDIIKLCNNNIGNKFLKPTQSLKILVKNKKIFFIPNYDLP